MRFAKTSKLWLIVSLLVGMLGCHDVWGAEIDAQIKTIQIEQASAKLPEVYVWYYPTNITEPTETKAELNGESLQNIDNKVSHSSIDYYFLLDISGSMYPSYFEEAKRQILQYQQKLSKKDTMTVMTVGNAVNVICEKATSKEPISDAISKVSCGDATTSLYEAIQKASMLSAKDNPKRRKLFVCITDGEDCSDEQTTMNEARSFAKQNNIALYGILCEEMIGQEQNPYIGTFGEFCRESGGQSWTYNPETATSVFDQLKNYVSSAHLLTGRTQNNVVNQKQNTLVLVNGEDVTTERDLWIDESKSIPDEINPTVTKVHSSKKTLELYFSESVTGAEKKENYNVIFDGNSQNVLNVSYDEGEKKTILSMESPIYKGDYTIQFYNITDVSAQKNPIASKLDVTMKDGEKKPLFSKDSIWSKYGSMIGIGLLFLLAMMMMAVVFYKKIKKNKGIVVINGKPAFQSEIEVINHIKIDSDTLYKGMKVAVEIENNRNMLPLEFPVNGSVIIGRSDMCDISIVDPKLSRQHFAILQDKDRLYIENLESKNGTFVNGTRVINRTELHTGDRINAGTLNLIIRW